MFYTFTCPVPCNRVIEVYADTDDDAINEMIMAGAMSCRNTANQKPCKMVRYDMPSLAEPQLREIIRISMEAEPVDRMSMIMTEKMTKNRGGSHSTSCAV